MQLQLWLQGNERDLDGQQDRHEHGEDERTAVVEGVGQLVRDLAGLAAWSESSRTRRTPANMPGTRTKSEIK